MSLEHIICTQMFLATLPLKVDIPNDTIDVKEMKETIRATATKLILEVFSEEQSLHFCYSKDNSPILLLGYKGIKIFCLKER